MSEAGLFTEIDHVAIAVRDLEAAIAYYHDTYGCEVEHREVVEKDGVEEALLKVADSYIQLLTPSRPDSTVAKYLDNKGEGLHHIGYRVADCAAALDRVKAEGHRVIDDEPRPGSRGTTVAFIHPKAICGTLIGPFVAALLLGLLAIIDRIPAYSARIDPQTLILFPASLIPSAMATAIYLSMMKLSLRTTLTTKA